ncbi:MAG: ABC transporter ATP-binding protein [Paraclostridium sp.]|uniref:ABC transporter ATP-binding protein n=1 Tax=Paraclostridium sp. TaxID=2023273 RepID=UPI003F2BAC85
MKKLIRYLFKYKLLFILRIITLSISSLSTIFFAYMLGNLMDTFTSTDAIRLNSMIFNSIFIIIFIFVFTFLDSIVAAHYNKKIIFSLKNDIFNKIIHQNINQFKQLNTGKYLSILNNDLQVIENGLYEGVFLLIYYIASFSFTIAVMLSKNISITMIILFLSIIVFFIPKIISDKIAIKKWAYSTSLENITSFTKDLFTAFEIIKGFNLYERIEKMFQTKNLIVEKNKSEYKIGEGLINSAVQSSTCLIFLTTIFISGLLIYEKKLSIGDAIIIVQLTNNIINPVNIVIPLISRINSSKLIYSKIESILDKDIDSIDSDCVVLPQFSNSIDLNNVSFSYDNNQTILDNINLSFSKGKKYSIVGESGSGKSTLVKLLVNYYNNYDGLITIDGINLNSINSNNLYTQISMIHQDVVMFDDSIKNNITLFKDVDESEVYRVVNCVGLDCLINSLSDGIESNIGENGNKLSGGQKQRIAIARALISKSKIIILDEVTSSLDNETAYMIEKLVLGLEDITVIAITHKLIDVALKNYDEIIVLKNGTVKEKGSFENLISKKSYFYNLYYLENDTLETETVL